MVFSSITFLCVFMPAAFIIYNMLPRLKYKNIFLIIVSLIFYAYGEPVYVFLMIICALINYMFALLIDKHRKKILIAIVFIFNLGILGIFKYAGMTVSAINSVTGLALKVPDISLPIGISFFTFQALSYVADVYSDKVKADRNFANILLYISFFPQLIAGPIVKYHDIAAEINERSESFTERALGVRRFIIGLSKKVLIANILGQSVDYVYSISNPELSSPVAWIAAFSYMLQIYFDFSGYSDMAIGLGKMFGFHFRENFDDPYSASSMQDFWRRWHISLTNWFREYVYIPLGGNRKGTTRTWMNRLFVFFCTGLWHGANWTFVLWGLYHGLFLTIETLVKKSETKSNIFIKILSHVYVILTVCIGFVIFRSDNILSALSMISVMFTGFTLDITQYSVLMRVFNGLFIFTFVAAVLLSFPVKKYIKKITETYTEKHPDKKNMHYIIEASSYALSVVLLFINLASLAGNTYNPFIYFRF